MLRDDPKFFVDVLKLIFRPRSEPEESRPKITEKDRALALHGFRLLSDWRTVPGSGEDGQIDEKLLLDWVHKARTLAEEHGLLEVCDSQIGQVLARDKTKEPDGSWPSIPVRDVLEEIGTESDNVFSGFVVGIYNKRGVYMMSPGGDQTRGLAKRFEQYAEACQIDWPQTAAALRQVAQGYERQAQREDAEATLD
jgi:hypothetical protein